MRRVLKLLGMSDTYYCPDCCPNCGEGPIRIECLEWCYRCEDCEHEWEECPGCGMDLVPGTMEGCKCSVQGIS